MEGVSETIMRAIKFRIWDNLKKEWVQNKGIWRIVTDNFGNGTIVPPIQFKQHENGHAIQQFTGLKDHKNVECYEGDIIRYFNLPPFEISYGLLGEVQFINGCFCIKCRDKSKGGNKTWITEFDELDYFEIVGNICETPELLK